MTAVAMVPWRGGVLVAADDLILRQDMISRIDKPVFHLDGVFVASGSLAATSWLRHKLGRRLKKTTGAWLVAAAMGLRKHLKALAASSDDEHASFLYTDGVEIWRCTTFADATRRSGFVAIGNDGVDFAWAALDRVHIPAERLMRAMQAAEACSVWVGTPRLWLVRQVQVSGETKPVVLGPFSELAELLDVVEAEDAAALGPSLMPPGYAP